MLGTARYSSLANTAFTVANWAISQDFGVPLGLREENEDMYAWSISDEIDSTDVQTIDRAEPINEDPLGGATVIDGQVPL
jgi:hypothetical protein